MLNLFFRFFVAILFCMSTVAALAQHTTDELYDATDTEVLSFKNGNSYNIRRDSQNRLLSFNKTGHSQNSEIHFKYRSDGLSPIAARLRGGDWIFTPKKNSSKQFFTPSNLNLNFTPYKKSLAYDHYSFSAGFSPIDRMMHASDGILEPDPFYMGVVDQILMFDLDMQNYYFESYAPSQQDRILECRSNCEQAAESWALACGVMLLADPPSGVVCSMGVLYLRDQCIRRCG